MRADVHIDEVVELTRALVAVDTRNPPGNEAAVAGVCRQALAPYGATITEVEPAAGRLSLLASVPHPSGAGSRPTLIVNGHLDVVPVQAEYWTHRPFEPVVVDGRLYGRGSGDMKGGIAAAICALGVLARSGRPATCDVVFHLVADEERGGTLGTRVLLERGLIKGDACLVPEPTSLSVCVAERGLLVADVIIRGKPGHGSRPRDGVSAIEHAASVVLALHAADFGDQPHQLLGTPTANVGEIRGGSGHNTVAESCSVVVDRRLLPGASENDAVAGLRRRIEAAGVNGLDYDLEVRVFGEASELDAADPFVGQVRRAIKTATGVEPPVIGMSFTTDARFVRNQAGIPAVVCGPGDLALAHGNDEWVSVDRLIDATAAYAELYASFGADGVIRGSAETVVDADQLDAIVRPRAGLVRERATGPGQFEQAEGPLSQYRRRVSTEVLPDGRIRVHQVVEFTLGVPYFSWLFALPLRWALRGIGPDDHGPWWAPPQRMTRRAAVVLATLAALAVVVGYLGTLLGLTMTYAAKEFGVGKTGQGVALAAVRVNVVLAFGVLILADRQGRRRLILATASAGAVLSATGALAPSLPWLTASQVLAVSLVAALLVLVSVMAAEEMPAGSRAWAVGLLGMATGLGGGLATMALPLAGLAPGGWRWLYLGSLLALPLVASTRRRLPESQRFTAGTTTPRVPHGPDGRRRLALIGAGAFLFALFATPSSQFQNEFLRTERAFSASRISAFTLVCGTIGGLGVMVGARMADVRGRRAVAAIGVGAGVLTTLASYLSRGWPLWAWGISDNLLGYAVGPALAVYGPELFPTSLRSRSTGIVAVLYAAGGVVGLVATGVLSSHFGTLAPAFAVLAVGPLILVVLIIRSYPETAGRELEDLNPVDRSPSGQPVPPAGR